MALISYNNKDNSQPTSDPRRLVRDSDMNEIKSVVNTNAGLMAEKAKFIYNEIPTGTVNGSNTAFTLANTPASGTLQLYADGMRMKGGGVDYTLSGANITMGVAPSTAIVADYMTS